MMANENALTRREMLELGAVTGVSLGAPWAVRTAAATERHSPATKPRNIIFMVADGMSLGVPSMAESFSQLVGGTGTHWCRLMRASQSVQGFFETHSLSSPVTDSAAASTAWASGTRVFNGALNVLPDGTELKPIGRLAREAGRRLGLVTTTTITHATPAGFVAVHPQRAAEPEIAEQYLGRVDVLMGGGATFFHPSRQPNGRDLVAAYKQAGYTFWDRRSQVCGAAHPAQILGLFDSGHLPYTLDVRHDTELTQRIPTLAEMTHAALESLTGTGDPFLLQIEGGRVDHAAHANDAAAMLWDQLAFDSALGVVLEFVESHPDTLVIVTSDHGNANPGLNGMGGKYRDSGACFERLAQATASFAKLIPRIRAEAAEASDVEVVRELISSATGITLTAAEAEAVHKAAAGESHDLNRQHANLIGALGQALGNHHGVGWTGITHTSDLVLLTAYGPGSARFHGLMPNTAAYEHLSALMSVSHTNPQMTPHEAQRYLAAHVEPAEMFV